MTERNNLFEDRRPLFYTPLTEGKRRPVMREMKPEK
jgi:hypothetical protein